MAGHIQRLAHWVNWQIACCMCRTHMYYLSCCNNGCINYSPGLGVIGTLVPSNCAVLGTAGPTLLLWVVCSILLVGAVDAGARLRLCGRSNPPHLPSGVGGCAPES
jgi:hypothetical protein